MHFTVHQIKASTIKPFMEVKKSYRAHIFLRLDWYGPKIKTPKFSLFHLDVPYTLAAFDLG